MSLSLRRKNPSRALPPLWERTRFGIILGLGLLLCLTLLAPEAAPAGPAPTRFEVQDLDSAAAHLLWRWAFPDRPFEPGSYQLLWLGPRPEAEERDKDGDGLPARDAPSLHERNAYEEAEAADALESAGARENGPGAGEAEGPGGGPERPAAILLRNGTEIARLKPAALKVLDLYESEAPIFEDSFSGEPKPADYPYLWQTLRPDFRDWKSLLGEKAGLLFRAEYGFSVVPGAEPERERTYEFLLAQEFFSLVGLGVGLRFKGYDGGLYFPDGSPDRFEPAPIDTNPFFEGPGVGPSSPLRGSSRRRFGEWEMGLRLAFPGFTYEVWQEEQRLPEFYFLERRTDTLLQRAQRGRLVKQFGAEEALDDSARARGLSGNLAHRLSFHFAKFRYDLHIDMDAYAAPIHRFRLEDLPLGIGRWSPGFYLAPGVFMPEMSLKLLPFTLRLPRRARHPLRLGAALCEFQVAYRDPRQFQMAIAFPVHFDHSVFHLPAGLPGAHP